MILLSNLYIAAAIFSIGITIIDMFGIFGHHSDHGDSGGDGGDTDSDGDSEGSDFDSAGHDSDHGDTDFSHSDNDFSGEHSSEFDECSGDHGDHENGEESEGSMVAHDNISKKGNIVFRILSAARNLVYFGCGFGPVGCIVLFTLKDTIQSLFFSIPAGFIFLIVGKLIKRVQRHELDSQVKDSELIMEKAEVLVSIKKGQMGKVRVFLGDSYVERYAKAEKSESAFLPGSKVRVVNFNEEYLTVSDD